MAQERRVERDEEEEEEEEAIEQDQWMARSIENNKRAPRCARRMEH
jgi:hypothetical protein